MKLANIEKSPLHPTVYTGVAQDDVVFCIDRDVTSSIWRSTERETMASDSSASWATRALPTCP